MLLNNKIDWDGKLLEIDILEILSPFDDKNIKVLHTSTHEYIVGYLQRCVDNMFQIVEELKKLFNIPNAKYKHIRINGYMHVIIHINTRYNNNTIIYSKEILTPQLIKNSDDKFSKEMRKLISFCDLLNINDYKRNDIHIFDDMPVLIYLRAFSKLHLDERPPKTLYAKYCKKITMKETVQKMLHKSARLTKDTDKYDKQDPYYKCKLKAKILNNLDNELTSIISSYNFSLLIYTSDIMNNVRDSFHLGIK